jgi:hypothetical protein
MGHHVTTAQKARVTPPTPPVAGAVKHNVSEIQDENGNAVTIKGSFYIPDGGVLLSSDRTKLDSDKWVVQKMRDPQSGQVVDAIMPRPTYVRYSRFWIKMAEVAAPQGHGGESTPVTFDDLRRDLLAYEGQYSTNGVKVDYYSINASDQYDRQYAEGKIRELGGLIAVHFPGAGDQVYYVKTEDAQKLLNAGLPIDIVGDERSPIKTQDQ